MNFLKLALFFLLIIIGSSFLFSENNSGNNLEVSVEIEDKFNENSSLPEIPKFEEPPSFQVIEFQENNDNLSQKISDEFSSQVEDASFVTQEKNMNKNWLLTLLFCLNIISFLFIYYLFIKKQNKF